MLGRIRRVAADKSWYRVRLLVSRLAVVWPWCVRTRYDPGGRPKTERTADLRKQDFQSCVWTVQDALEGTANAVWVQAHRELKSQLHRNGRPVRPVSVRKPACSGPGHPSSQSRGPDQLAGSYPRWVGSSPRWMVVARWATVARRRSISVFAALSSSAGIPFRNLSRASRAVSSASGRV